MSEKLENETEVGSKATGFAKGKTWGPFTCGECIHFLEHSVCDHPKVIQDASRTLEKRDRENRPFVAAQDCCRYQRREKPKNEAENSGMRG